MALYIYLKKEPEKARTFSYSRTVFAKLPNIMFFLGLGTIFLVIYPILSYKYSLILRKNQEILSPIPEYGSSLIQKENPAQVLASNIAASPDFEEVNNWFPQAPFQTQRLTKITDYTLSIPKLKIKDARVKIGGKELKETLIQYASTALPGEYGNVVIFGHSVLPQFFNPKEYKTIFSTIPTLKKGDQIIVDFDGIKFTYQVERYFEVNPSEVEVLEQRFDRQSLSLITCVPPGTYWKRGIIQAYLDKI